jgi:DNA-binding transcriptional regulator YiaG
MLSSPNPAEIKAVRERHGHSQPAAAKLLGVSLRTWQRWEAGEGKTMCGIKFNYYKGLR